MRPRHLALALLVVFAVWARLPGTYSVAVVAPFTLLVPISGFVGSAVLPGEAIEPWKIGAAVLVIAGLCINLFGRRLFGTRAA